MKTIRLRGGLPAILSVASPLALIQLTRSADQQGSKQSEVNQFRMQVKHNVGFQWIFIILYNEYNFKNLQKTMDRSRHAHTG